jgi:hypothetical protein
MTLTAHKCKATRNANGTWNVFGVPTFITHNAYGIDYDRARLDLIVANTAKSDRIKGQPKIIVHHSGGYSGPNIGRMRNLRRVEDVLLGDYTNLRPAVFANWAKDGYPGRSVQLDPVTFDRIEAVALLGDEEPHFPLSPIEIELTDEEWSQLNADIEADKSFAHAYSRGDRKKTGKKTMPKLYLDRDGARKLAKFMLENPDADAVEIEHLFKRDGKGKLAQYMLEPEDAQDIVAIVEESNASIKETQAMIMTRLDEIEKKVMSSGNEGEEEGGTEEGVDDADFENDADDEDDTENDFSREGDDAEDEDGSEGSDEENKQREDDSDSDGDESDEEYEADNADDSEDEEDDMSKRTRAGKQAGKQPKGNKGRKPAGDLATFERLVKAEASNARHKGEKTFAEFKRRIVGVLDPAIEADVDAKAEELTNEVFKLQPQDRSRGLEMLLNAYQQAGVPTGHLPADGKKSERTRRGQKTIADRAREYHREHKRVMKANYAGLAEDDFVKHVEKTFDDDPDTEKFSFLRD